MEYEINEERLDKVIKPFFDKFFKNSVFEKKPINNGGEDWTGFWLDNELIIGHPSNDDVNSWYFDGTMISFGLSIFNLDTRQFSNAFRRYLKNTYGLEIKNIS